MLKKLGGYDRNDWVGFAEISINYQLWKYLTGTKIVFAPSSSDSNYKHSLTSTETIQKKKLEISGNVQCPCGSGKKYCECHGRNIRNKPKRR